MLHILYVEHLNKYYVLQMQDMCIPSDVFLVT